MATQHIDSLIIGAGQAGLATGYQLQRRARECRTVDGVGPRAGLLCGRDPGCRGVAEDVYGLSFGGLLFQYALASSVLPGVGRDAAYVAQHITDHTSARAAIAA